MMNLKIFANNVEDSARAQIDRIQSHPAFFPDAKIRIMPDVHFGSGCVIGFTSTMTDLVVPNIIGVDIGCGVRAVKVGELPEEWSGCTGYWAKVMYKNLDYFIRQNIPSSHHVRNSPVPVGIINYVNISQIINKTNQEASRVFKSIGTLGGGNHFIELDLDEDNNYWLVVHTGSRGFGKKIADHFQELSTVPEGLTKQEGYLEGQLKTDYLAAMEVAQGYAALNREIITKQIMEEFFKIHDYDVVESVHNYINFKDGIIRKGAISANEGENIIIPWNMRDGTVIGKGKGNDDWNCSAPHGAGRTMGRNQAKKNLSLDEFKETMKDVWSSCVNENTLDEAPMAYKDCATVESLLSDTVEITHRLKPMYNFKAEESRRKRYKKG